jgi:hypothetical protein
MIKHYFLLILAAVVTTANLQAQCGSCSTTISNASSANQLVNNGQTLCITSTGTVSGLITVLAGGKICNQGLINSTNVWIAGGALINTGTINVNNITVSSAGSFTNEASFEADSFLVYNNTTKYYNNGTQTNLAFATADHATSINNGTLTTNVIYDSIGDFTNNGNLIITDGFANGWGSTCINNGNITITNDFANGYSSIFINNKNMSLSRDFYNGTNSNYTTKCMVTVGRNWFNSAAVLGPNGSCGGFNIGGASSNSGAVGTASTFIDICDAGHPAGGFDANAGGNVASTTTYCTCANNCMTVGLKEIAASGISALKLYPNPASDHVILAYSNNSKGNVSVTVKDMMGRIVLTKTQESYTGTNELEVNTGSLAEGTYILSLSSSEQIPVSRMFTIVK